VCTEKPASPTDATDYSLWKATHKIIHSKQHIPPLRIHNNTWTKTGKKKGTAFAEHLATVFRPSPSQSTAMDEEVILHDLSVPHQMALPLKNIRIQEVEHVIHYETHLTKAPGYDLITGKILKELFRSGLRAITQIIMIAKQGKKPGRCNVLSTY
jgi:hypothetical protein